MSITSASSSSTSSSGAVVGCDLRDCFTNTLGNCTQSECIGNGSLGALDVNTTSQVINQCTPVILGSGSSLEIEDDEFGVEGGVVFVLQVQDGIATSGDNAPIVEQGNAGAWDLVRVLVVEPSALVVEPPLRNSYVTSGTARAQVCTVPEYGLVNVNNDATVAARPWDGSTGGVLLMMAQTLNLEGNALATASGRGFRGGVAGGDSGEQDVVDADTLVGDGGGKGEGLDASGATRFGRGNVSNGAGGGNAHNAGGGGGGGGGMGGQGGRQFLGHGALNDTAGMGGAQVLMPVLDKVTMGGGGGAGQQDNALAGNGGAGGGVVVILVGTLTGTGEVRANGAGGEASGVSGNLIDGAGGGGGGGTILLRFFDAQEFSGVVRAEGRHGGDVDVSPNPNWRFGPGGGGGGGRVLCGTGVVTSVVGGRAGRNQADGVADTNGAVDGEAGEQFFY